MLRCQAVQPRGHHRLDGRGMSSSPSVVGRSRSSMPVDSTMKNGLPPARP